MKETMIYAYILLHYITTNWYYSDTVYFSATIYSHQFHSEIPVTTLVRSILKLV